jgi:hypothetical protein
MPRKSRTKGLAEERKTVRLLQAYGLTARKDSRTGYAGHDATVTLMGTERRVQIKVRGDGFRQLYSWLDEGADVLILRGDRKQSLVVLPMKLAAEVAAKAAATGEASKEGRSAV